MGELGDRLSLIVAQARSPDRRVTATVRGRREVEVGFMPGAYQQYRPAELARQLEALAALVWAGYRRRYLEVVASWVDGDEPGPVGDGDREFDRRLALLEVEGASAGGGVRLRSRALVSWQVSVENDPAASLSEHRFLAELDSAVAALLGDYDAKLIRLTDELCDIGLPRGMRA